MKVYIAGPMRGMVNDNKEAFDSAENMLRAGGFSPFNPAWCNYDLGWSHDDMMWVDLHALEKCDLLYMLKNWEKSVGANQEKAFAEAHSIPIVFQSDVLVMRMEDIDIYTGKEAMA